MADGEAAETGGWGQEMQQFSQDFALRCEVREKA